MIQDSGQVRRQGAQDFWGYYEVACARQESVPLPAVKANLHKHMLDFNGDRLKLPDWQPVLASISINKHLQHIAISSTYQASVALREAERRLHRSTIRRKIPAIRSKDVTFKLCKALRNCLSVSSNLRTLQLHGLPLRERDLIMLTKGLAKSASLENFSLANCPIMDEGLEVICQSVMYSTSIKWVDFSGCSLTWRGAEHMANIVKHQGLQRHGTAWAESLRYRLPRFEQMLGLRRLTLNSNSLIGDRGAVSLARELAEDLWVKAVDLQRCGLSNEGARRLLEALKTNSSLCVLDIRNNPLVDKPLVRTIIERVLMNPDAQSSEYSWIKPASPEPQRACGPKRRLLLNSTREKSTSKTKVADKKTSLKEQNSSVAHTQRSCYRSSGVPWRAAARAERQRALPPGVTVSAQKLQAAASVKITLESDSGREDDEDEEKEEEPVVVEVNHRPSPVSVRDRKFEHIQVELKECRLMLAEEKRARLQAESHIMKCEVENTRLRDANRSLLKSLAAAGCTSGPAAVSVLEDEAIIESIENSFTKFHAFLDLLKDAGLGQLASMAGIDNSDFQCLGKPQLSSTLFPNNSNGAATPNGGAKTGTGSLGGSFVPVGPDDDIITPAGWRSCVGGESDVLQDVALSRDLPPAAGAGAETLWKPTTTLEHSVNKGFQSLPVQSDSSSSSHRSSFNNSSAHKRASERRESHRSSSANVSDVMSEKADSVRSTGWRDREFSRLVTASRSGSEGSRGKDKGGVQDPIRALRALEGQSDSDSF